MVPKVDVVVLGAGIVGVSLALHLQQRGRSVALIDRHGEAGLETSYGNAGLIERSSIFPYMFPRELGKIARYALNASPEAHYHLTAMTTIAPWLWRYWRASSPEGAARTLRAALPLIERSLLEHEALMEAAGATGLLRKVGWTRLYKSDRNLAKGIADAIALRDYGLDPGILDAAATMELEPNLQGPIAGSIHLREPGVVSDPKGVAQAYAALFVERGGAFLTGEARSLASAGEAWSVSTREGTLTAGAAVVALGPWSDDVFRPLGYRIPLGVKRGYHVHFTPRGNAALTHPVLDVDGGYVLAPMRQGIRLTTGAEFARRDAPATPVQIGRTEPIARALFPLAERIEAEPWMGARPCLPDMLPVIGRAARHRTLWFDFGHQHHGFTLGPVSGRLLAEMMTGETPFTDPAPYAASRFG